MHTLLQQLFKMNLVKQIIVALFAGCALAYFFPHAAGSVKILGDLFVTALKSVAPLLVFVLISASIANYKTDGKSHIRPIIVLYLLGTFSAALVAVIMSFLFPSTLTLTVVTTDLAPPKNVMDVFHTLLFKMVDNPFNALIEANYIGLLMWGIGFGLALRHATDTTRKVVADLSYCITFIVKLIIRLAPLGIFGIVASTFAEVGFGELLRYAHIIAVLLSCMLIVVFIVNPILIFWKIRRNPYPLIFMTLKESAITAFFSRSSAANIPINMALCKKLKLPEDTYSISIPLGATINMAGAAITITVLTLGIVNTLNFQVDLLTALLLSLMATLCACGASGVAGGSLLLIPVACSLFGVPDEIAMQAVVSVGFVIGIIQDSAETAVNSSTDVAFTAAACEAATRKNESDPEIYNVK